MGDVTADHIEAIVSDRGDTAPGGRAGVECHAFADNVACADHKLGLLTLVAQVLRIAAQPRKWVDDAVIADLRLAIDDRMGDQPDAGS